MSDSKIICWSCNNEVELIVRDNRSFCPICGCEFKSFETKTEIEKQDDKGSFLRSCLVALLVLAAIFFVLLAFIFAQCSQGMHGI